MRLFVLGASGGVGTRLVAQAVARGHQITAQTRTAGRVTAGAAVDVAVGSPAEEAFLRAHLPGHDAVVSCIGVAGSGRTTVFSDATRALVAAMQAVGPRRLIAVTGVGAGETRGHGGWLYNRVIFPFFTRQRYADKDRQEALIARTDLDWTIVRPAPFSERTPPGPLRIATEVAPDLQLSAVTRAEVAGFLLDCLEGRAYVGQRPFIGHP